MSSQKCWNKIPEVSKKSGMAVKPYRFLPIALQLFVERRVHIVHIFLVHPVLGEPQPLAKALEMDDLSGPQKTDGIGDIGVIAHAQNVVIGQPGFLLCCIRLWTTFAGEREVVPNRRNVTGNEKDKPL